MERTQFIITYSINSGDSQKISGAFNVLFSADSDAEAKFNLIVAEIIRKHNNNSVLIRRFQEIDSSEIVIEYLKQLN